MEVLLAGPSCFPPQLSIATPPVSAKQTAPPAEDEPITRRLTPSLAPLKVRAAKKEATGLSSRKGGRGEGEVKVEKGRD